MTKFPIAYVTVSVDENGASMTDGDVCEMFTPAEDVEKFLDGVSWLAGQHAGNGHPRKSEILAKCILYGRT